ncbi:hypothetical protein ACLMJK_004085 [Lecanora helva]
MGCCHSTPRVNEQSSPYSSGNVQGDSSSRAITSSNPPFLETSSPRTSSQLPPQDTARSRNRRPPLGEQFNAPLRAHIWTAKKQWTRTELDRERQEFFETRVTGRSEIWATLKAVVGLLAEGDIPTAQSILDAAAITVPTGDLKNGVYDEAGNLYQLPDHIISDPQNLVPDQGIPGKGETSNEVTDDDEELERKREEKGKAVLKKGDILKVKARLSDRGGPDVIVTIGKDQPVRMMLQRIREEANVHGKVKIAYMGKILKDAETLQAQGWREGHVVNALVFNPS